MTDKIICPNCQNKDTTTEGAAVCTLEVRVPGPLKVLRYCYCEKCGHRWREHSRRFQKILPKHNFYIQTPDMIT